MMVQDRRGRGLETLEQVVGEMVGTANQTPELASVFSLFNTKTPRIFANIDRVRAEMLGVNPDQVFETLEVYLGSAFVNDFNLLGRTYRVRSEEHTSELQSLMRISYAVFCLKKKNKRRCNNDTDTTN